MSMFLSRALIIIATLSCIVGSSFAQSTTDIKLTGSTSLICRLRAEGNLLVASGSFATLNFKSEQTKVNRSLSSVSKSITKLKSQLRTLGKQKRTTKIKSQIASKKAQLSKKNKLSKGLKSLLTQIKLCESNKISTPAAVCGNGIIETGELCDGNCPTSCSVNGCGLKTLQGSASTCNSICVDAGTQSACSNGDGCCPSGCNSNNDSDCSPTCGNGVVETGELCDGANLGGSSCASKGFVGGTISCSSQCQFDTSACTSCSAGQTKCGNSCVDLTTDRTNCGSCGTFCTGANICLNGTCQPLVCPPLLGNCDNNISNGCETLLLVSPTNCGSCGTTCPSLPNATPGCLAGLCGLGTCLSGFDNCDAAVQNGCEVNTKTSVNNCGGCGIVCLALTNAAPSCSNGFCGLGSCTVGFGNCDLSTANGCETSLSNSVNNCGTCGHVCPAPPNGTASCSAGNCSVGQCNNGFCNLDGNPTNGCELSLNSNPVCPAASPLGQVSGDSGQNVKQISGTGDSYFFISVTENDNTFLTPVQLLTDIALQSATGTDYDLDVYCANCGATPFSSNLGAGAIDHINVGRDDNIFSDQSYLLVIHVKFFAANTCSPWTLTVRGNFGGRNVTCP